MKKNNQYVGVDEKFIPEEDKYVDETKNSTDGLNEKINEGIDKAKPYAKKGLKIAKRIGIGYLVFVGFIFLMVIIVFVTIFVNFFKVNKMSDDIIENSQNIINNTQNNITGIEKETFNNKFEIYSGTKSKNMVSNLLDTVVTNNKKDTDHLVIVIFNDISTIDTDKIIDIKRSLDDNKKYEVILDYSNSGYVNKVTIEEN